MLHACKALDCESVGAVAHNEWRVRLRQDDGIADARRQFLRQIRLRFHAHDCRMPVEGGEICTERVISRCS